MLEGVWKKVACNFAKFDCSITTKTWWVLLLQYMYRASFRIILQGGDLRNNSRILLLLGDVGQLENFLFTKTFGGKDLFPISD